MDASSICYACSQKAVKQTGRCKEMATTKWPNRKKWCFSWRSCRHFVYLSCTDRHTSAWKSPKPFKHSTSSVSQWPLFLLATLMYFKAHMFLEGICWKHRHSFAHVTLNNLEASRRAACGVRFALTSWNFEGSFISLGENSMSRTLQHPTADRSLRKVKSTASEGHRHLLPRDRAWLRAQSHL